MRLSSVSLRMWSLLQSRTQHVHQSYQHGGNHQLSRCALPKARGHAHSTGKKRLAALLRWTPGPRIKRQSFLRSLNSPAVCWLPLQLFESAASGNYRREKKAIKAVVKASYISLKECCVQSSMLGQGYLHMNHMLYQKVDFATQCYPNCELCDFSANVRKASPASTPEPNAAVLLLSGAAVKEVLA